MSNFLKKMQKSLIKGEKDSELTEYMKTIEDKVDKKSFNSKALEDRQGKILPSQENLSDEEILEMKKFNKAALAKIKEDDEKWAMLAIIENMKTELVKLKVDYEKLKEKYEKNISDISDNVEISEKEFTERFGEVKEILKKTGFDILKENYEKRENEDKIESFNDGGVSTGLNEEE